MSSISPDIRIPVIVGTGQYIVEEISYVANHYSDGTDLIAKPQDRTTFAVDSGATEIVRVGDYPEQDKYKPITHSSRPGYTFGSSFESPARSVDGATFPLNWTGATYQPANGAGYYVTYGRKVESDHFQYKLYTDEKEMQGIHGTESVSNLVSLGGILALRNGAPAVGVVQLDLLSASPYTITQSDLSNLTADQLAYTTEVAFVDALGILEELDVDLCRVLVPMTTNQGIIAYYLDHVDEQSLPSLRRWRTLIAGVPASSGSNVSVANYAVQVATGYRAHASSRRISLCAPGDVSRSIMNPTTRQISNVSLDGSAVAAAVAGRLCSFANPAVALTNRQITGVTLDRDFSRGQLTQMGRNGVCSVWNKRGQIRVVHGLTCDLTDPTTQEQSVVEIEDYVKRISIARLEDQFIGAPLTRGMFAALASSLQSIWEDLVTRAVIVDYDTGSIQPQQGSDPRNVIIDGRIRPAFPLTWLDINFMLTTGTIAL